MADASKRPLLAIPREVCRNFEQSSHLEWLETNHTGGFAMGTVAGVNTRRYHGLLIAALNPPADRYSILPRLEERVVADNRVFELGTVQYPGGAQPRGFELLTEFRSLPFPCWRYGIGANEITKTICLLDKQPRALIRYEATTTCRLEVRLTLSFRDYHSLTHKNAAFDEHFKTDLETVIFRPYPELPALLVNSNGRFQADGIWFLNHEYLRELERGLDFREDLFSPGSLIFQVGPGMPAFILAGLQTADGTGDLKARDVQLLLDSESERREPRADESISHLLHRALDQFRIERSDGKPSLLAGYPWFTDWSRDTLISLPAFWKADFDRSESKRILSLLAESRFQGILPNRFADKGSSPEYNSVDASLWFFVSAEEFLRETEDIDFLRHTLYAAAQDVLDWHFRGTLYNIHVDLNDRLLWAGTAETQLTWMDAKVDGVPVTPRSGKPVEVNALWYNALCIAAHWSRLVGLSDQEQRFESEAQRVRESFRKSFWNAKRGCLYDVLTQESRDGSVRPNQLFALCLPFPLLEGEQARSVAAVVRDTLVTNVGLRTLEPGDERYRPHFEGSVAERDSAYHQGTVWPWLVGPFIRAYLYAYDNSEEALSLCESLLLALQEEMDRHCLGSVPELYDGSPPHRAGGCPGQLWSVAQFVMAREQLRRAREQ